MLRSNNYQQDFVGRRAESIVGAELGHSASELGMVVQSVGIWTAHKPTRQGI